MIFEPERYPFVERVPAEGMISLSPLLPIMLTGSTSMATWGLLDTGAAVNVLPCRVGLELGAVWDRQLRPIRLSGNLAPVEARGLVLSARVGPFPAVPLAFAWAETDEIPILPGQMNFLLEFDVCFHRSRSSFEVRPNGLSPIKDSD